MSENLKEVIKAWLDGEVVEFKSGDDWLTKSAYEGNGEVQFYYNVEYRIKPRTIRIGKYDVPAPLPVDCGTFDANTTYYSPDIESMDGTFTTEEQFWCWDRIDVLRLERGLVHLTREAAELHAKALISFTEVKP